eukprot:Em0009g1013a
MLEKAYQHYDKGEVIPQVLEDTNKVIAAADAYVVLAADIAHLALSATLLALTLECVLPCRPGAFLGELSTPSVGTIFSIPVVYKALTPEGEPSNKEDTSLNSGADKLISELEWKRPATTDMAKQVALKFVVFLGTVRENNFGSRVAKFIVRKLETKGHSVKLLDPAQLKLPLLEKAYHHYGKGESTTTASPPALTNLMDHFFSYKHRPSGIVCYSAGPYAGVRSAMQARAFLGVLGTPSVGTIFSIPVVYKALTPDGLPAIKGGDTSLDSGADKLISELEWYAVALKKKQRDTAGLP